jgi:Asp-tRNA(Asn)/Glu-tRNA(Gln) amidotransferase C subunit
MELRNVFKADQIQPSLPRDEALANAPHHDDRGYLVPAVLGD